MSGDAKMSLKKLARSLLGDYAFYYIYASPDDGETASPAIPTNIAVRPVGAAEINASEEPLIRDQAGYLGPGAHVHGCFVEDRLAGLCVYWFGDRYLQRNFWPLKAGEAKLVEIVIVPSMRGKGLAAMLIGGSFRELMNRGFSRAYARIWHSNTPSLRAFERTGWTRIALVLEINPFRRPQPIRIRFNLKGKARN